MRLQAGASSIDSHFVVYVEPKRLHKVKGNSHCRSRSGNVAGVLRDLRVDRHQVNIWAMSRAIPLANVQHHGRHEGG